ncbi:hypothetical protein INR49_007428, partial [Caranx melampygus]
MTEDEGLQLQRFVTGGSSRGDCGSTTMFLKRNTYLLVCLLCSLSLWCKSASAGSSFLSPAQKPQGTVLPPEGRKDDSYVVTHLKKTAADAVVEPNRGKSPRVGRQVLEEPAQPTEDTHLRQVTAPFEIAVTMTTEDLEEYGVMLQEFIQRLLGNTEAAAA